jgi:hypothetical protein
MLSLIKNNANKINFNCKDREKTSITSINEGVLLNYKNNI